MKRMNLLYWVITALFAAFMIFSAIPDILNVPQAVEFMTMLGYPPYFTPFIGVAKLLGSIAILIPGYPRIKEWAYAGLIYDLIGATYSVMCVKFELGGLVFMTLIIGFGFTSYALYHKRAKLRASAAAQ